MRSAEILILLSAFLANPEPTSEHMTINPLTISVECEGNPQCQFNGDDIEVRIRIRNSSSYNVGVPVEYLIKRGPHVQLTDVRSGANRSLRITRPPRLLRDRFTVLAPNEVFEITTTLYTEEIRSFRHDFVDLEVEVSVGSVLKPTNGDPVKFSVEKTFNIAGRDTEELRKANRY